jgi:HTH-type transcriptional regulator / antitoxin HigA
MEQMGLKQKDLARFVGGENRASEILNNKRGLTLSIIKSLNKNLKIPAEILIA